MNPSFENQLILRRLLNELASALSSAMTFNQIAKVFFESGIIDTPERPYGVYPGSKTQYAIEKLISAQNKNTFPEMLSTVQFDLCYPADGPVVNDKQIVLLMKLLGYKQEMNESNNGDPTLIPPTRIPTITEEKKVQKRIVIENLPTVLNVLVDELNDNLDRGNLNASALLIRKILTLSSFIVLDKVGKSQQIEDKELHDVLSIVQKELKLSDRIMSKVRSTKWIGDSANHSFRIKINDSDVEVAATGLRIYLGEIF